MFVIRQYAKADKIIWDDYVRSHPESSLFHLTGWKETIEKTFGHKSIYLLAFCHEPGTISPTSTAKRSSRRTAILHQTTNNGQLTLSKLVGVLPLFRIKNVIFGNYLVSMPFAELGGILADNDTIEKRLLDRAINLAEDWGCEYIEFRNSKPVFDLPVKSMYFNFKREISQDLDQNLKDIPRKARRMIRQGKKKGLTSEIGNHLLPEFYHIFAKSYHQLGTPVFSLELFKNFMKNFGNNAQILLIRNKERTAVASVMTFFFKKQVIPYYAGSIFEYRNLAPNDFMYWELMRFGCENGYKIFDFGRSKKDTGSYHFKRHWGFQPVQLAYQYQLLKTKEIPNLSPSNPKYQRKIKLWRKMPLAATKILGPPIAKYLA